jgi:hypothetical protein
MEGRPGADDALSQFFSLLKGKDLIRATLSTLTRITVTGPRATARLFPDAQYTLVEPQEFLKKSIQDLVDSGYKILWITAGAGDAPGCRIRIVHL